MEIEYNLPIHKKIEIQLYFSDRSIDTIKYI